MRMDMVAIENIPDEALQEELERRKREKEEREKPKPVENPDWRVVYSLCTGYIEALAASGWPQKDSEEYVFEEAMMAVYGRDVFSWIREKLR